MTQFNDTTVVTVKGYVSGVTKASEKELRLANISFKTDKETGIKRDSVCVSIPYVKKEDITENLDLLLPTLAAYLQSIQNDILREGVIDDKTEFTFADFNLTSAAKFAQSISSGERVTREVIETWFNDTASEVLTVAVATKLGITQDTLESDKLYSTLESTLETYKGYFMKLAGTKTAFGEPVIAALKKSLSLLPVDSSDKITKYLLGKLDRMSEKPTVQLLAL